MSNPVTVLPPCCRVRITEGHPEPQTRLLLFPRMSSGEVLDRCTVAMDRCRSALSELRRQAKDARSHRQKCSALLGAATTVRVSHQDRAIS